jgi:hypothetical protein
VNHPLTSSTSIRTLRRTVHVSLVLTLLLSRAAVRAQTTGTASLLDDDYHGLSLGMFSGGVVGAMTEYHYLPAAAPKGNWVVSCFRTDGSQRAWRIVANDAGERFMYQSYAAADVERAYMHPMVIAGDELWGDYRVRTKFAPDIDDGGIAGIVFRYRDDRRYYFVGVAGQKAILKKVDQGVAFRKLNEAILAEQALAWKPGQFIDVEITVAGDRLRANLRADDTAGVTLEAQDATFPQGKVGLTSDMPTRFGPVHVTCTPAAKDQFDAAANKRQADEDARVASNPKMVLWKKFNLRNFGVGRNLRFGDLDGDGKIDVMVAQQKRHGPADGHSEVGCLTALNFDGEILWQNGQPDSWNHLLTNDVAVQIHDIDGDGKNEVIYCRDFEIVVADGATGKTKYKAPTPATPPDVLRERDRWPHILGDSLCFADFRGTGAKRDFIVKDRYKHVWAYDDRLNPLWTRSLNTGHFPFPYDVDGDGKDELMCGYSLLGHDGNVLWTNEKGLEEHADGVAIVRLKEGQAQGQAPKLISASSDEGLILADARTGRIEKHHQIGHAQNVSIADYRPDLSGLEIVTINFWGNQGIVHMFDADGNLYHDFEPAQHGSMMLPVNWTGGPGEFWALSPNTSAGGLFDGWGHRVVRFPADGHPDMCLAVLDLTGDCRDEIVVWDPWELWVYTQSDGPRTGRLYKPARNRLCNESNYRATVSLPGWSE